jgi:type IV secretory pathway VirB9-like protein
MTGILEGDAVPDQFIPTLIAREPTGASWIDALQLHPYAPGALYRLYAAPESVSDIALQPGDDPVAISAGHTVRWVVGDTTSGRPVPHRRVLNRKPMID